jgi:hypothetical protein
MISYLQDLAAAGFVALSFDPWQHGVRGTETQQEIQLSVSRRFRCERWAR